MVSIAVRRGGGACRDPEFMPFSNWAGSRAGLVLWRREYSGEGTTPTGTM